MDRSKAEDDTACCATNASSPDMWDGDKRIVHGDLGSGISLPQTSSLLISLLDIKIISHFSFVLNQTFTFNQIYRKIHKCLY